MTAPAAALVVGVAIVKDGRLLVARRTAPPELAGQWELPGGKVEAGESASQAAVREIAEELGLPVFVTAELPGRYRLSDRFEMAVVLAVPGDAAEATPSGSHDTVRWFSADELSHALADPGFPWVPADVPALAAVSAAGWLSAV